MSRERKTTGLDRSRALLERLGWAFTSDRLTELIEQGVREELTLGAFLELVADPRRRSERKSGSRAG